MVDLLRPLMHHKPTLMLTSEEYCHFLVDDARVRKFDEAKLYLDHLEKTNELDVRLLPLMKAWEPLSSNQREEMLNFFEKSMLLCRIAQRADTILVSARTRSVPALNSEVASILSGASHVALYLLPISHIGIIPQIISRALSKKLAGSHLITRSGGDTLLVHRQHAGGPCCAVNLFPYAHIPQWPLPNKEDLVAQVSETTFSGALCVASCDFGLFQFMVKCADDTMDSCSFGARFQSWCLRIGPSPRWVQFEHSGLDAEAFEKSSLTHAMGRNIHETVAGAF